MQKVMVSIMSAPVVMVMLASPVLADVIDDPVVAESNEALIGGIIAAIVAVTFGVYKFFFRKKK